MAAAEAVAGVRCEGGVQGPLQHAECGGESRVPWRHEILHIEMNIFYSSI